MYKRFAVAILLAASLMAGAATVANATTYAAPPADEGYQGWVTTNVNVRNGPGTQYGVLSRAKRGDYVNVVTCEVGWCFVDRYGGNGWVSERFINSGPNPMYPNVPAGPGIPPQEPSTYAPEVGGTY